MKYWTTGYIISPASAEQQELPKQYSNPKCLSEKGNDQMFVNCMNLRLKTDFFCINKRRDNMSVLPGNKNYNILYRKYKGLSFP